MPNPPDTHCSRCGVTFENTDGYPRQCVDADCGVPTWANPVPVSVVLVPVSVSDRTGLLVIRRGIQPGRGQLAIVGGFVDAEEAWQSAGAREVLEESGIKIDPDGLTPFWFTSTEPRPNRVLLFATSAPIQSTDIPAFDATDETTERGVVFGPAGLDEVFAFDLHAQAARRWFEHAGVSGPHDYAQV